MPIEAAMRRFCVTARICRPSGVRLRMISDGRYWTDFDRSNPIEAAARGQAWTGTAHGLIAELGVGTVTHSTLQLGLAFAGVLAGLGLVFLLSGAGLYWAGASKVEAYEIRVRDDAKAPEMV
jgi:hypothetical protein